MRSILGMLLLVGAGATAAMAECAPERMQKIVFLNVSPGIDPQSFDGLPRTFYRWGSDHGRLEEPLDTANNVQGLLVVNQADTWIADLVNKSGSHLAASGLRAPVVTVPGFPEGIYALQLGCEIDYMLKQGIASDRIQVHGLDFDEYVTTIAALDVRLLVRPDKDVPFAIAIYEGAVLQHYVRYKEYAVGLDPDESLFAAPAGVTFENGS